MIAVVNYGLGNLHSVQKAIAYSGGNAVVTDDPKLIQRADKVVLPGVGAFAEGMKGLETRSLTKPLKEIAASGKPILGICLGMQLLFESSEELGAHPGLGVIPGKVKAFTGPNLKIPQIGWNNIIFSKQSPLLTGLEPGSYVYFNHSYYCQPDEAEDILATTTYGITFTSAIQRNNIYGVQFHPEKSQRIGLKMIRNFVECQNG
jgi:glutamine amidotransferase